MNYKIGLLSLTFLLPVLLSFAQGKLRGSVKGKVIDSTGKQILSDATVSITPETDTTDTQFAIADKNGNFSFRSLTPGNYHLLITFEGYHHIIKKFTISADTKDIDFAAINMQRVRDLLQEVIIQRPPMSIKKDTIEYNAEMFATKPNAFVEDQLKKLPGVEVDASGNIIAQGRGRRPRTGQRPSIL